MSAPTSSRTSQRSGTLACRIWIAAIIVVSALLWLDRAALAQGPSSPAGETLVEAGSSTSVATVPSDDGSSSLTARAPARDRPSNTPGASEAAATAQPQTPVTGELAQDATPAPSASPLPAQQPAHGSDATPAELSPVGMFLGADIIVKSVMIGLVLTSVLTWTVWLYKTVELHLAKRDARAGLRVLTTAPTLAAAASELHRNVAAKFVAAALREVELSAGVSEHGVRDRLSWQLERVEAAASRRIAFGMGLLATIGAVAHRLGHHEQFHWHLAPAYH